jgi:hypothetical protein
MAELTEPSAEASAALGRVPDFFIVGHPKTGTTALYRMLREHPQIFMSEVKEPRFFANDLGPLPKAATDDQSRPLLYPDTFEQYAALFAAARADQRVGEATPTYLRSHVAAAAIAKAQPAARIVAILREPASFLRSLHLQRRQEHTEQEPDLMKAISFEESRRQGILAPGDKPRARWLLYVEFTHYVEQLRRYEAVFPREQMLVLIYDDFRLDNEQTIRRVLRFLEVDDTIALEAIDANPTVAVRSEKLERLVGRTQAGDGPLSGPARALATRLTPERLRRRLLYPLRRRVVYREPTRVDEAAMTELRRRFKPEVVALSEYLDRDLVGLWGYDSLE